MSAAWAVFVVDAAGVGWLVFDGLPSRDPLGRAISLGLAELVGPALRGVPNMIAGAECAPTSSSVIRLRISTRWRRCLLARSKLSRLSAERPALRTSEPSQDRRWGRSGGSRTPSPGRFPAPASATFEPQRRDHVATEFSWDCQTTNLGKRRN